MMLKRTVLTFLCSLSFFCYSFGQSAETTDFRIVGYFKGDIRTEASKIDFAKITHLNVAFINPDSNGVFQVIPGLSALVAKAHENNVKVLAALGGGKAPKYYAQLISEKSSTAFITAINGLIDNYDLDGIDVDIEGSLITAEYEGFVNKLAAVVRPKGLLTAALATNNAGNITDAALKSFNFINIMSYDKTGPWRPEDAGPHASYEMAVEDIKFWSNKGLSKQQINLGVPFYGYAFNSAITSMSYKKLLEVYPGSEKLDELKLKEGGVLYYNGLPTIREKTKLALKETGGIMIWQLTHDSTDKNSLLRAINEVVRTTKTKK
jgi:chitinase